MDKRPSRGTGIAGLSWLAGPFGKKIFGQSVDSFQNGRPQCGPLSGSDGVTVRAGRGGLAGGPRPREGSSHECWGAGLSAVGTTCSWSSRRTGCTGGSSGGPAFATSSRSQCRYRSLISCFMPGRSSVRWAARTCPGSWGVGVASLLYLAGAKRFVGARRGPAGGRSGGFAG
jgi:hypothetical protein